MLHTDPASLGVALSFMGFGMGGVFVVLGIFFGLIKVLLKLFPAERSE